ncbi:MAG: DUF1990 family protein [Leucobacter sp.]
MNDPAPRRSSHVDMPVAYAAVGASKLPDLVRFPPEGSTPYEEELRLGSGQERFVTASSLLMTWGAQRGSGVRVEDVSRGSRRPYRGPSFDEDGNPQVAGAPEEHFAPDGEPYIVAGTTAVLRAEGQDPRSILVVYTVDEERRVGFAWGTCDEAGAVGEQLFVVELREDDTVWAVTRGFLSAPKNGLFGIKGRSDLRTAIDAAKAQIAVLAPGVQPLPAEKSEADVEEASATVETEMIEAGSDSGSSATEPAEAVVEDAEVGDPNTAAPDAVVGDAVVGDSPVEDAVVEDAAVVDATEPVTAEIEVPELVEADPVPHTTHQRRPSRPAQ